MIQQNPNHKSEIAIRKYQQGDAEGFRVLNEEWITRYFRLEEKDLVSLRDPEKTILARGGHIYMAVDGQTPVGCCALLYMSEGEYEVAKMAVTADYQRGGVGRRLLSFVVEDAKRLGARRLYLETNDSLLPALRLYRTLGFTDVPADRVHPSPYARANVFMELWLR